MTHRFTLEGLFSTSNKLIIINTMKLFAVIAFMWVLAACSSGDDKKITLNNDHLSVPLPAALAASAIAISESNLFVDLQLTDTTSGAIKNFRISPVVIDNNNGTVAGNSPPIPVGDYMVEISYVFKDGIFGDVPLIQFDPQPLSVQKDQTTFINLPDQLLNYIDTDQDSFSNLTELEDTTNQPNPFQALSVPNNPVGTPVNVKVRVFGVESGKFLTFWEPISATNIYNLHMDVTAAVTVDRDATAFPAVMHHEGQTIDKAQNGFGHSSLLFGTPWYIVVTSQDAAANNLNTIESMEVFVRSKADAPDIPTNITVESGDGQNIISWDVPVNGADVYTVYSSTTAGVTQSLFDEFAPDLTQTSYTHNGLQNGTMYFYVVTAVKGVTESADSSEVGATPYGRLAAPIVGAIELDSDIRLDWKAIPNALSYIVYMASESGVSIDAVERSISNPAPILVGAMRHRGIADIFFNHPPSLLNGSTYYFRVAAVDRFGRSGLLSPEIKATPRLAPLP